MEINDIEDADLIEVAVADSTGEVSFHIPVDDPKHSPRGTLASESAEETKAITVDQYTLGDLVSSRSLPLPNILKIDIEGAEALLAEGLDEGVLSNCRTIYTEVHVSEEHSQSIYSHGMVFDDYCDKLESLGFESEVLDHRGTEIHLKSTPSGQSSGSSQE